MIPDFTRPSWNSARGCKGLHPGLAFYRLFDAGPDDENKRKEALALMATKTSAPFAGELADRMKAQLASLESTGVWKSRGPWEDVLATRMAVGMGIPHQTENGLWLDRTHGAPVVPGSVLKGVTQDWALVEKGVFFDGGERRKAKRTDPEMVAVFGMQTPEGEEKPDKNFQARRGHVVFFDALPVGGSGFFDTDIMNPHYGDYYSSEGDAPPADYLNPNPIVFLTVKAGTRYRFALAARPAQFDLALPPGASGEESRTVSVSFPAEELLSLAEGWLRSALTQLGAGGKTRAGYGIFRGKE